jgi:hypothetical protein
MIMRRDFAVRRLTHILIALAPLYYSLPVDLPYVGLRRWVLLIVFFAAVSMFEAVRLWKGITFLGLRPHERNQIASFAWAAAGITVVLWLFPHEIATAALIGMAIVDPLIGELRNSVDGRIAVPVSFGVYFVLCVSALILTSDMSFLFAGALASVGSAVAIASENLEIKFVDDDFLMAVLPAVAMTALWLWL